MIIRFNKPSLKMNVINNKDFLFGKLGDFVADSTCRKIDNIIGKNFKCSEFETSKIFYNLTEKDSISQSRLGDMIQIPDFYGCLLVKAPVAYNIKMAVDTLQSIKPDINYAEYNYLYTFLSVPNDLYYPISQTSLHPTNLQPNAHINCQPAWDIEKGKSHIKVGIFDTGIAFTNNDLNGTVAGGFDYYSNTTYNATDNDGHGTSCAGIIGAKSNNAIGITGIAGGDAANNQSGVSLYTYRIGDSDGSFISNQNIGQAMITGANSLSAGGDALHIMNNSWGIAIAYDRFLMDGINYVNRAGVAFVAARGNSGSSGPITPATLKDQVIMSVGASGNNGHYVNGTNGDQYSASYGLDMDFIAPGTSAIIKTTKPGSASYGSFNGTSAAAPHVSGLCGLLMSYKNMPTANWDNLTHEDCEQIIERTCTDLDFWDAETSGYDAKSGYGRINAGAALAAVEFPKYKIRHINLTNYCTSFTKQVNLVVNNQLRYFQGNGVVASGNYFMNIYEIVTTLNYAIKSNEQILGAWPLYKASTGAGYYANQMFTDEPWNCNLISYNNTQAVLKTYSCLINTNIAEQAINYQYPFNSLSASSAFSLYTYDPTAVSVSEKDNANFSFSIYPNPARDICTAEIESAITNRCTIKTINMLGRACSTTPNSKFSFSK